MILLHCAVFLFGVVGVLAKFLTITPAAIVFGRALLSTVVLGVVIARWGKWRDSPCSTGGMRLIPSGALLAVHWLTFFHAIQISTVATGLLAVATFPIFVSLLDPFFSSQSMQRRDLLCAVSVFAGLLLVIPEYEIGNRFFQGLLWGLVSAITFALLTLYNRHLVVSRSAEEVGFYQSIWAACCLFPWSAELLTLDAQGWLVMILLGVFCTALSHTLFIAALSRVRPQVASIAAALEPVYGVVLAVIFLQEYPSVRELAGGVLIVATVIFASSSRRLEVGASPHLS